MITSIYDWDYFKVNQIVNIDKMRFLEEFSDFENMVIRKMFLQLKFEANGFYRKENKKGPKKATRNFW